MRSVVVCCLLSIIDSILSGAPCSIGGATFAYLAFLGGRCLSYAMTQSYRVLLN